MDLGNRGVRTSEHTPEYKWQIQTHRSAVAYGLCEEFLKGVCVWTELLLYELSNSPRFGSPHLCSLAALSFMHREWREYSQAIGRTSDTGCGACTDEVGGPHGQNLSPLLPTSLGFSCQFNLVYGLFLKEFWGKQEGLCQKVLCIHYTNQENISTFMEITTTATKK